MTVFEYESFFDTHRHLKMFSERLLGLFEVERETVSHDELLCVVPPLFKNVDMIVEALLMSLSS